VVVLQGILAALQRIERSLDGQREETASLRKVLESKSVIDGAKAGKVRLFWALTMLGLCG
jgi:hypothetical protein